MMERWTKRTDDGVLLSEEHEEKYTLIELIDILLERLAAYEDTGLAPDDMYAVRLLAASADHEKAMRLCELAEMDAQGRLVVLPCKVGDELFRIVKSTNACFKPFVPQLPDKAEPCGIYYKNLMGAYTYIPFEDFGKTVFLTREEAEQALKGGADHE